MPHHRRTTVATAAVTAALAAAAGLALTTATPATADSGVPASTLTAGTLLNPGETMTSPANGFTLTMQTDGNLVEYLTSNHRPVWASGTVNRGHHLAMQPDGNLVLYTSGYQPLWSTNTGGTGATTLTILGDGTLSVRTSTGKTVWTKNPGWTSPDNTVVGGMSATRGNQRFDLATRPDGNAVVTLTDTAAHTTRDLWSTNVTTHQPGYLVWQSDGNVVLYDQQTRRPTWATGTYTAPTNLVMQDDGNLVAYNRATGRAVWATNTVTAATTTAPPLSLGNGFTVTNSPAADWVRNHTTDSRAALINQRIATQPSGLWLTGTESMPNLRAATSQSLASNTTMTLVVYNIPGRDDGVTPPSGAGSVADYTSWITSVAQTVGNARAIVVLEPDALWFVDRQTPPGTQKYTDRMASLNNAVNAFAANSPNARVYLDAGTSSGSVTAGRMAQLLDAAGLRKAAGYAVNTSSFAPTTPINTWANAIRSQLQLNQRISDPRYVIDTGRNGNPSWDYTWCNPSGRRLGVNPALVNNTSGLDFTVWAKQPGTSDGSCGVGPGTYGGQFMPDVATAMITG